VIQWFIFFWQKILFVFIGKFKNPQVVRWVQKLTELRQVFHSPSGRGTPDVPHASPAGTQTPWRRIDSWKSCYSTLFSLWYCCPWSLISYWKNPPFQFWEFESARRNRDVLDTTVVFPDSSFLSDFVFLSLGRNFVRIIRIYGFGFYFTQILFWKPEN
jgi:hypothetical protein